MNFTVDYKSLCKGQDVYNSFIFVLRSYYEFPEFCSVFNELLFTVLSDNNDRRRTASRRKQLIILFHCSQTVNRLPGGEGFRRSSTRSTISRRDRTSIKRSSEMGRDDASEWRRGVPLEW